MRSDLGSWMRDYALVGGATGALAPMATARCFSFEVWLPFAAVAGLVGAATGPLFGALLRSFPTREGSPYFGRVAPVVAVSLLGGWGGGVGRIAALLTIPNEFHREVATLCGVVAALAQLGWFAAAHRVAAARGLPRLPLVLVAALTSPVCGLLGAVFGRTYMLLLLYW